MIYCIARVQGCREPKDRLAACVCEKDAERTCEGVTVSEFSPGFVQDNEFLARSVVDPDHYQRGELHESLFDDMFKFGMSCIRSNHESKDKIHARGKGRIRGRVTPKGVAKKYVGYVLLSVEFLRNIDLDRGVRVYDTAEQDFISHADVVASPTMTENRETSPKALKELRKRIKSKLLIHARAVQGGLIEDKQT